MKRLVFAKPVTRLTPGYNDYTNPNSNPTRPLLHLAWPGGRSPGRNYRGWGNHRGKLPASTLYINYMSIYILQSLANPVGSIRQCPYPFWLYPFYPRQH